MKQRLKKFGFPAFRTHQSPALTYCLTFGVASPASQKLPVIDAEALAQVLAPLREPQQNLDAGGLDGAVSNAEQLYHAYVDTSCSDAIDF